MDKDFTAMPLGRITLWGFALNMVWEFGQCVFFYDMWEWGFWRATLGMWIAILGDVVVVLGVVYLGSRIAGDRHFRPPHAKGWVALLLLGFVAGLAIEWLARALGLWEYSRLMPTLTFADYTIGISPIIQVTLLPTLSVYLATRNVDNSDVRE